MARLWGRFRTWIAVTLAATATAGVGVMALSSGGSVDVFVGSTPTPVATPTPTATPSGTLVNLGVAQSGTCDSTPTREATAVALASLPAGALACTPAQATSAASSGDKIGLQTGEHAGPVAWGDGTKTLEYVGEDGAVVDVGTAKPNYNGFQFNSNATVTNVDVCGSYPIVGLYGSNITYQDSEYCDTGIIRDCGADEPFLIEGEADAYTISNVTVRNVTVGTQRGHLSGGGTCPGNGNPGTPDDMHLEIFRIGKGVDGVLLERMTIADCDDGAGFVGCGTALIFLTTTSPGNFEPRNIVIRNSKFGSAPNATVKIHPNVTPCQVTLAYNTGKTEMLVLQDSSACAGSSFLMVGNAGEKGSICFSGVTFVKNLWTPSTGGNCGSDARTADLQLDANQDPEVGSPVINAGETPGASDYCTGDLGSVDIDGVARPIGVACDTGAVEAG